jgi:CRISPR-associated protein Cas5d
MEYFDKEFCLDVSGPMACFTRPELKVERVSYDVITPSAIRAIFEAIFWKPAIRWQPTKVEVLCPIRWTSIRRNEVGAVGSPKSGSIYIEEKRQQKNALLLRDVHYRIYAKLVFIPKCKRINEKSKNPNLDALEFDLLHQDENPGKYNAMFERRASKGQCFNQPYLGVREFSADFRLVTDPSAEIASPIDETRDLGIMLYDLDFSNEKDPQPMFFRANMEHGTIIVPPIESEEILR